jgi:hypothetical protein
LFPPPDILPKANWREEIARMSLIRANVPQPLSSTGAASRMIPLPPDFERVLKYYEANAPAHLAPPAPWPAPDTSGFVRRPMNPNSPPPDPAVANVRLLDVDGDGKLEVLAADMRYGLVMMGKPATGDPKLDVIAQLDNPCHVTMVDINGDGIQDFLVADLGTLLPGDHTRGSVTLLLGRKDGKYDQRTLGGWPRVADIEAADFNGDGKLDLAVAAFGWRKVGNLSVLENRTTNYAHPSFTPHLIDPRPGAIHAIPVDLNKDGKMDLVVVFAQQFEQVVAFMNNGGPGISFSPQVIYTGPHPNWGSSGIQVVDLDGDGDLDVLLTHGDTFDDAVVKPYHGIQWLENRGAFPFVEHTLAEMPGVSRAQAVDLDGDGDLDIVAVRAAGGRLRHRRDHAAGAGVARADQAWRLRAAHARDRARRGTRHSTSATSITTATSTSPWARSCSFPDPRRPPTGWRSGRTSGRTDAACAFTSAGGTGTGDSPQLGFVPWGQSPAPSWGLSPVRRRLTRRATPQCAPRARRAMSLRLRTSCRRAAGATSSCG